MTPDGPDQNYLPMAPSTNKGRKHNKNVISFVHIVNGRECFLHTLSNHYIQMDKNYSKMHIGRVVFVCTNGYTFNFLQLLLCCVEILLEKYLVRQLTVPSSLVVKQNFLNTNIIVNYHVLMIIYDQDMVTSIWVLTGKPLLNIPHII